MKKLMLMVLGLSFLWSGAISLAESEGEGKKSFPNSPPSGFIYHTVRDGVGTSVKMAIWEAGGKLYWYLEPVPGGLEDFHLYPGDMTVTQGGKLYEEIKLLQNDGQSFSGPVKKPVILEFKACSWDKSAESCIDLAQPFELHIDPNLNISIQKGSVVKVNPLGVN